MSEDLVNRALNFAAKAHENQHRKFNGEPYIVHPIGVAEFVALVKQSSRNKDMLLAVALLHDILEDTLLTYEEVKKLFGYQVADLVVELTSDKELAKFEGKGPYLLKKMIAMSSYALVIKLADILYNMLDLQRATGLFRAQFIDRTEYILRYLPRYRKLTATHEKLIKMIKRKLKEVKS